ncbi:trypsin-like peptidase domain-containing protein [Streptomyces sp. NPDC059913]|uniref:trypsin-like peptidase domain-containing protein n=1 Tax=unclassified Streptomyces TaxID=2593676 RepID=UPI00365EAFF1
MTRAELERQRLALIRVSEAARVRRVGTGYLIAPGLVLTAGHVVRASVGSASHEIHVGVGHPKDTGRDRPFLPGKVCWVGPDGLDVALLRLKDETDVRGTVRWGRAVGNAIVRYDGLAFPFAVYKEGQHNVEHLRGELPPLAGGYGSQDLYSLNQYVAPRISPNDTQAWAGASGAAVFCQDHLVGVVIHNDEEFDNRRLRALPARRFATEPTFVEALRKCGVAPPALANVSAPPATGTDAPAPSRPDPRIAKLHDLKDSVLAELERDPVQREVRIGRPLPMHCRAAPEEFTGRKSDTRRISESLASTPRPGQEQLLNDIAAVYLEKKRSKLLVLGQAGSGKSVLIRRFAQARLEDVGWIEQGPVPVIFSLGSWNPDIRLGDWLTERLERDHFFLAGQHHSKQRTWAAELIENGDVLAILDGFDEMAKELYKPALDKLKDSKLPILLTSRPEALVSIQEDGGLFPGIELTGLTLADYNDQLGELGAWEDVLKKLNDQDSGDVAVARLADVLSTPLMFTMAEHFRRSGGRPADLLELAKDDSPTALQGHLLDSFLSRAYSSEHNPDAPRRQRWSADNAKKWLGYLATHLTVLSARQQSEEERRRERQRREQQRRQEQRPGKHPHPERQPERQQPRRQRPEQQQWDAQDIAWWQLGTAMSLPMRMLVSGSLCGLVSGTVCVLVGFLAQAPLSVSLTLFMNGLGIGVGFGLVHGIASKIDVGSPFKPSRMQIAIGSETRQRRWERVRKSFLPRAGSGLVGGVVFGIVYGGAIAVYAKALAFPWLAVALILGNWIVAGPLIGLGIGIVLTLTAWFEREPEPNESTDAADRLRTNRTIVLVQASAAGLALALGYGAAVTHFNGRALGLQHAISAGLAGALGVITLTAWGRWLVLVRFWLPLLGHLPWRVNAFLDEAWDRGVLRRTGAVYQFRHAQLRDHLAKPPKEPGRGSGPAEADDDGPRTVAGPRSTPHRSAPDDGGT